MPLIQELLPKTFVSRGVGLELGASFRTQEDLAACVAAANRYNIPLIAHNYFYPPGEHFVLNLSDPNPVGMRQSLDYAVDMLDYCAAHNIKAYSIHSGFACSFGLGDFGQAITRLTPEPLDSAYSRFIANVNVLAAHAKTRKVELLLENNVLTTENLSDGMNLHLLCVDCKAIIHTLKALTHPVRWLLDLGHLKVSAATLGLSLTEECAALLPVTGQIHLHDNDGKSDLHLPGSKQAWFWEFLRGRSLSVIFEQPGTSLATIFGQISLAK